MGRAKRCGLPTLSIVRASLQHPASSPARARPDISALQPGARQRVFPCVSAVQPESAFLARGGHGCARSLHTRTRALRTHHVQIFRETTYHECGAGRMERNSSTNVSKLEQRHPIGSECQELLFPSRDNDNLQQFQCKIPT